MHAVGLHLLRQGAARLLFVVTALRQLFQDENFVNLLRAETLDTLPTFLASQIQGQEMPE